MSDLKKRIEQAEEEVRKGILNTEYKQTREQILKTIEYVFARQDVDEISGFRDDVAAIANKYSNKKFPGSKTGSRYNRSPRTTLDYGQFKSAAEELLKKPGFVIYDMIANKLSIPESRDKEARLLFRGLVQEQNLSSERAGRRTAFYRRGERPEFLSVGEAVRKYLTGLVEAEKVSADEIYRKFEGTYNPHEIRGALSKTDYRLNRETGEFERVH
jgi:ribosomal protein L19E